MPTVGKRQREQLIWAAGFFDGEGCICLFHNKDKRWFSLHIVVVNTDPRSIERFVELFPFAKRKIICSKNGKWKPRYEWRTQGKHAGNVLEQLLPYLINKKEEAEIAIAWAKAPWRGGKYGINRGKRKTDVELTADEKSFKTLKILKKQIRKPKYAS